MASIDLTANGRVTLDGVPPDIASAIHRAAGARRPAIRWRKSYLLTRMTEAIVTAHRREACVCRADFTRAGVPDSRIDGLFDQALMRASAIDPNIVFAGGATQEAKSAARATGNEKQEARRPKGPTGNIK